MKPKILLVESGQSGEEIVTLNRMGNDVIFLYTGLIPVKQENLSLAYKVIKDKKLSDYKTLIDLINTLLAEFDIVTLFTTSDFFVDKVARICEKYNFPTLDANVAETMTNKFLFREKQKELQYATPRYYLFSSLADGIEFLERNEGTWVFKPLNSNESVGVRIVHDQEELEDSYNALKKLSRFSAGLIKSDHYMLEEYISGEIISCEFIKDKNDICILGITSRVMGPPPFFIELGYEFPYTGQNVEEIYEYVKRFVQNFSYDFGPCHIELIINEAGIYILEVNPRLVGYPNYWMLNKALNIDILRQISELYINRSLNDFSFSQEKYTICEEIIPYQQGYVTKIVIPHVWKENPDVLIISNVTENMFVRKAESNKDILLRILVSADNKEKATELINNVKKSINIEIS